MTVDNGTRVRLIVAGVFDGVAGMARGRLAFVPNRSGVDPVTVRGGLLDGRPVLLAIKRDRAPFYSATYTEVA